MKLVIFLCFCTDILLFFVVSSQPISMSGTCASIGYSNVCCPSRNNCRAADGNCYCSADCHALGNCCPDVHCPSRPTTCADVGITSCCNDSSGTGRCDVYHRSLFNSRYHCSCNISCHQRNDCCTDAVALCIPQTCSEAGKNAGSCVGSCYIPGGRCYCDALCQTYGDCCGDVSTSMFSSYYGAQLLRSRIQSKFNTNQRIRSKTYPRNVYNGKLPAAARVQKSTK